MRFLSAMVEPWGSNIGDQVCMKCVWIPAASMSLIVLSSVLGGLEWSTARYPLM